MGKSGQQIKENVMKKTPLPALLLLSFAGFGLPFAGHSLVYSQTSPGANRQISQPDPYVTGAKLFSGADWLRGRPAEIARFRSRLPAEPNGQTGPDKQVELRFGEGGALRQKASRYQ